MDAATCRTRAEEFLELARRYPEVADLAVDLAAEFLAVAHDLEGWQPFGPKAALPGLLEGGPA